MLHRIKEAHREMRIVLLCFCDANRRFHTRFFFIDWIYGDMYNIYVCLCHLTAYMLYLSGDIAPI